MTTAQACLSSGALVHMLREEPVDLPKLYVINEKELFDGRFIFKSIFYDKWPERRISGELRLPIARRDPSKTVQSGDVIQVLEYDFDSKYGCLLIEDFVRVHMDSSSSVSNINWEAGQVLSIVEDCHTSEVVSVVPLYAYPSFEGKLDVCLYTMLQPQHRQQPSNDNGPGVGRRTNNLFKGNRVYDRRFLQILRVQKREFDVYSCVISDGRYYIKTTVASSQKPKLFEMIHTNQIIDGSVVSANITFFRSRMTKPPVVSVVQRSANVIGCPENIMTLMDIWDMETELNEFRHDSSPLLRDEWIIPDHLSVQFITFLESIDWSIHTHARGAATDIPQLVLNISSPDERTSDDARMDLFSTIFREGFVFDSTLVTMPTLIRLLDESISESVAVKNVLKVLLGMTEGCVDDLKRLASRREALRLFAWERNVQEEETMGCVDKQIKMKTDIVNFMKSKSIIMLLLQHPTTDMLRLLPNLISDETAATVLKYIMDRVLHGEENLSVLAALLHCLAVAFPTDPTVNDLLLRYLKDKSTPLLCQLGVSLGLIYSLETAAPVVCLDVLHALIRDHTDCHELRNTFYPGLITPYASWHIDVMKALVSFGLPGVPVIAANLKRFFEHDDCSSMVQVLDQATKLCFTKTLGDPSPEFTCLNLVQRDLLRAISELPEEMVKSKDWQRDNEEHRNSRKSHLRDHLCRLLRNYGLPHDLVDLGALLARWDRWERRRTLFLVVRHGQGPLHGLSNNVVRYLTKFM
eukprot:GILK01010651.1.p1 GENE.GILK01010651.1~~GILK01010651.1.p1  ORF type:complete len:750 (-),score=108.75 GILK01010651.1:82-2331(-)